MPQVFNKVSLFWLVRTQGSLNSAQTLVVIQITALHNSFLVLCLAAWNLSPYISSLVFHQILKGTLMHISKASFLLSISSLHISATAFPVFSVQQDHHDLHGNAFLFACGLEIASKDKAEMTVKFLLFPFSMSQS